MCNCKNILPQSYDNQVELPRPLHMAERVEGSASDTICIDRCLSEEIKQLWSLGIITTGCCCGHNNENVFPYIGVIDECIEVMKELGYAVQTNPLYPEREDSFIPKTIERIEDQEKIKVKRFADQMLIELTHNQHKGSVLDWDGFDNMIMELEYHKSKMLLAIRAKNHDALKEYIADTANILLAIGNKFGVYNTDSKDENICYELNKENLITGCRVDQCSRDQSLAAL